MWLIKALLLFLWIVSLDGTITSIPLGYISYSSSSIIDTKSMLAAPIKYQNLTVLMRADDSPFEAIALPFEFNFFGSNINYVYASPNGGLHTTLEQPCYCGYTASFCFMTQKCKFNTSYYGIIAGVLTDLYPVDSKLSNSNINVSISSDYISVKYHDIRLCTDDEFYNTFDIDLFRDGHVEIIYRKINLSTYLSSGLVSSGLRAPQNLNEKYGYLTASQISASSSIWKSVSGVYPSSTNAVDDNKQFTVCPISLLWGASPSTVSQSGNMDITLYPAAIGCGSELEIALHYSSTATLNPSTYGIINCYNSHNAFNGNANDTYECDGDSLISSLSPGDVTFYLYWRQSGTSGSYTLLSFVDPITIDVIATGTSSNCVYNSIYSEALDATCNTCDICNRNFTCLSSLECELNDLPVVYEYPDCNDTCIYSSNLNDYSYLSFFENSTVGGDCCPFSDVDCAGECGGGAIITNSSNAIKDLTCCLAEDLDCYGICYGKDDVDACGVCGGDDKYGTTCDLGYTIYGIDNNEAEAVVDVSTNVLYALVVINITNTNSTYINVVLDASSSSNNDDLGPDISFIENNVNIPGNDSALFHVNVSFYSLFDLTKKMWQSKEVKLTIKRPSFSVTGAKRSFVIYPQAVGCSNLTISNCINLPGCFYCMKYEGMRVLLEGDNQANTNRSLYTAVIPSQEGSLPLTYSDGYCIDGWNTMDCPDVNGAPSRHGYLPVIYFITINMLCIFMLH